MSYTPIALFCYRRLDTLQQCIESLKTCPEAIESDLVVFSDAASNIEVQKLIVQVRDYIKTIDGFKSITLVMRENNLGVDNSIIEGIKHMSENYDSFIVVEDDLILSDCFLRFMNQALDFFIYDKNIITISGTNFLQKIPPKYIYDFFKAGISNPWGWATWSHKIKHVDWPLAEKEGNLKIKLLGKGFNWWASDRYRMLKRTMKGEIKAWDIRLDYYMFRNNFFTAYSIYNLVKNIGFNRDDSTNTFGYNRYKKAIASNVPLKFKFTTQSIYNNSIISEFRKANSLLSRIITQLFKVIGIKNQYE